MELFEHGAELEYFGRDLVHFRESDPTVEPNSSSAMDSCAPVVAVPTILAMTPSSTL
jgi:hypothetical protein